MKRVKIEVGWNHLRSVRFTSCHEYINGWRTVQIFWCFDFFFFLTVDCVSNVIMNEDNHRKLAQRDALTKTYLLLFIFFVVRQSCCPDSRSAVFWRPKILNVIVYGAGECHCNEEEQEEEENGIRMAMLILAVVVVVVVVLDARIGESMRPHAVITTHSHTTFWMLYLHY